LSRLAAPARSSCGYEDQPILRWVDAEWTPTPEQRQAVDRLVAACDGGVLVRELADGSLEVLTQRRGALGRHSVAGDGSSLLVESRPRDWRWWGGPLVWCVGFAVFLGFLLIGFLLTDGPNTDAPWWIIIPAVTGFAVMPVGWALMPSPHRLTRRGERWVRIGFPEE
jgi:hypothetical protein